MNAYCEFGDGTQSTLTDDMMIVMGDTDVALFSEIKRAWQSWKNKEAIKLVESWKVESERREFIKEASIVAMGAMMQYAQIGTPQELVIKKIVKFAEALADEVLGKEGK